MDEETVVSAPAKKVPAKRKPAMKKPVVKTAETPQVEKQAAQNNTGDPSERTRKELAAEKKVTVIINSTTEDKDDVFVAVNGYAITIQRDKEVQIPFSVYQALMDAKSTVYRQVKREDGEGMQMVETEIQRFSMSARF